MRQHSWPEENDLLVGELGNWRVQRVTLQPMR